MLLAKDIAGFSDNQADTYLRKAMAKKKRDLLELCKGWFIYGKPEDEYGPAIKGGIANGYDEKALTEYFDSLDSYCSYLFNKSHATSYSLNSMITAWLKHYYPVEFYASVLSIQDNKERCINYMHVIEEQFGITTVHPDINKSGRFFTPNPENNTILFGLNSIKGVGEAALDEIIAKQPYSSLEDLLERTEKRVVNKKVMEALIKSGCFDCWNENRYEVMNQYYKIRKVKDVELYDPLKYDKSAIIQFEVDSLEIPLTAHYWFDDVANEEKVTFDCEIVKVTEKYDRNGNLMAFVNVVSVEDSIPIELLVFSSTYSRYVNMFDKVDHKIITVTGKKDNKKVLVNKVRETR